MSEQRKPAEKRRRWTKKAKIEVVPKGLRGQGTVGEICRRHGITQSMFHDWIEKMLEAGVEGFTHGGRSAREAKLEKHLKQARRAIG